MAKFTKLVSQNIAPCSAERINIYNSEGMKLGNIRLGNLTDNNKEPITYSFGAISDVHLQYDTAQDDFIRALNYFCNVEHVDFICVCGDLTANGSDDQLSQYKSYVDTYTPEIPVYSITGNHETWSNSSEGNIMERIEKYSGNPLFYSFQKGDDIFIMLGIYNETEGGLFADGELQWFYETLEANRNKRCFVFQHVRPQDSCGNAYGIYNYDIWGGAEAATFENLMKHYLNVILFHGHSHLTFNLQTKDNLANIDKLFGCWSIHIPSVSVPRTGDITGANSRQELYAESEGYVVDVFEDGIRLKGLDFSDESYVPLAYYWLDTPIVEVKADSLIDTNGIIVC